MRFRKKDRWAILIILFVLILAAWLVDSYINNGFIYSLIEGDADSLTNFISEFGFWSYFIFILLIILEAVFAPIPPLVLYVAGGTIFGGLLGGILALIGNIVGAALAFQVSHHYGKERILPKIPKGLRKRFDKFSNKYGPQSIFFLRVNPFTTSDVFSYLAGLTSMNFYKFLIGTAAGLLPIIFLQTYLGEQIQNNPIVAKISIIIGALYVGLFFIGYFLLKKKIELFNKLKRKMHIEKLNQKNIKVKKKKI